MTELGYDPNTPPDEGELADLEEERADRAEERRLTSDKSANYRMIRNLVPIAGTSSFAATNFMGPNLFTILEWYDTLPRFKEWVKVEGGEIQARESTSKGANADYYGYLVVRPSDFPEREYYLRLLHSDPNSVAILPRSDVQLPRQGKEKERIMEQMVLFGGRNIKPFMVWLERMKAAAGD